MKKLFQRGITLIEVLAIMIMVGLLAVGISLLVHK
jgi:hypothetical protein